MSLRAVITLLAPLASLSLTFVGAGFVAAQDGFAAFAEGKKLIVDGKDARPAFRQALRSFEQRDVDGLERAALAQNLGNAAFLAGDLPRSILAFRYGLFFDRHHSLLRDNLAYARSQVRYPAGNEHGRAATDIWPSWLPRLEATWYVTTGMIFYCLTWLALVCWVLQPKLWRAVVAAACFAMACAALYGCYLLRVQAINDLDFPPVIVRFDDVPLRTGNGPSYPLHAELPRLARGMEARRLGKRGAWLQIQFATGEIGWIEERNALSWEDLRPQRDQVNQ
jgi:hypothetical protein